MLLKYLLDKASVEHCGHNIVHHLNTLLSELSCFVFNTSHFDADIYVHLVVDHFYVVNLLAPWPPCPVQ